MAQEYQNEKSPIFDSQKSKKTRKKLLKLSHIKAYKVDQVFRNTRYLQDTRLLGHQQTYGIWNSGKEYVAIYLDVPKVSPNIATVQRCGARSRRVFVQQGEITTQPGTNFSLFSSFHLQPQQQESGGGDNMGEEVEQLFPQHSYQLSSCGN